jgi:hypothetical protein
MADNKNDVKEIDLLELFQLIGKGIKKWIFSHYSGDTFSDSFWH